MSFRPKTYFHTVANGHLELGWPDSSRDIFAVLSLWLRLRYGLRRAGPTINDVAGDTAIFPDFVTEGVRRGSGWDNWSGYYLLSEDDASDQFLRHMVARDVVIKLLTSRPACGSSSSSEGTGAVTE
jgi:hypothetical protein